MDPFIRLETGPVEEAPNCELFWPTLSSALTRSSRLSVLFVLQRRLQPSSNEFYEHIGCFSDQGWDKDEDRALDKGFASSDMTLEVRYKQVAASCVFSFSHFFPLYSI